MGKERERDTKCKRRRRERQNGVLICYKRGDQGQIALQQQLNCLIQGSVQSVYCVKKKRWKVGLGVMCKCICLSNSMH